MRWTFIGFVVEGVGIFYLFGEYVFHASTAMLGLDGPEVGQGQKGDLLTNV